MSKSDICKECGNNGKSVSEITLKSLVKDSKFEDITNFTGFHFCETPTCNVVYFNNEQNFYLHKEDVKVRVGIKETEDPIPVCYCFGWTQERIFNQIKQQGYSTVIQEISAKVKAGECACEINNPSGRCCLEEVKKVIERGMKLFNIGLENKSNPELMELYKDGDMNAFEIIYSRYAGKLYNFFLKFTGDAETSKDLLQETFYKIHKARKSYYNGFALSTWIFTIAKNVLKDKFKKQNKVIPLENITEPTSNPEDTIEKEELEKAVQNALNLLPEDEKIIIILSKYENMKYKEIAKILKTTTGAVKVKAHRAYKTLREYLKGFIE